VPRVSVLLPVRDAGVWLQECLDSLARQTLDAYEVVAVDDGSRDGSGERLLARARLDPRLRVLRLSLAEARAPVVARMDADDVAHPARLALQLERLERDRSVDVLGCRVEAIADPGRLPGPGMRAYVEWTNGLIDHDALARNRFVESPLVHPSVAMRAACLRRLGAWRDGDGPEDYELWLRAFDAGLGFAKLEEVLLAWRDSPGRLTRTDPHYTPERFLGTKLEALARGPLSGRAAVIWGAGPIGKRWARALQARGVPLRAFVEVDPRKLGSRIQGAPVVGVSAASGFRDELHLAAVGQRGARERIRAEAAKLGFVDGRELIAVA
jgi:hypothetical protein